MEIEQVFLILIII